MDTLNRNWKSCWVLKPSRVQIPHPPPTTSANTDPVIVSVRRILPRLAFHLTIYPDHLAGVIRSMGALLTGLGLMSISCGQLTRVESTR